MSHKTGDPINGQVHAADASTATAIPIYNVGSLVARTLAVDEYIRVESVEIVTDTAADVHVFISTDATPSTGETVARGTFAANGGLVNTNIDISGRVAGTLFVKSSVAAVVDVIIKGAVHNEENIKPRPSWRESLVPGQ